MISMVILVLSLKEFNYEYMNHSVMVNVLYDHSLTTLNEK